ncbi:NAD(P)-binding domain-containing protein, partial [Nocardiopsis composta]
MATTATGGSADAAPRVSVLGLGAMGSAIARTFVERGYRTTVWNRNAAKSAPLVDAGASA